MIKLSRAFHSLQSLKALILGDFFTDTYTTGRVKRISPEAPVQVLEVLSQESRPGGAGNAAKNLRAMGCQVIAIGRIGDDAEGQSLQAQLCNDGIDASQMICESNYKSPIKNRLIADSQQLLRVDFETVTPLPRALEPLVIEKLQKLIPTVQVIAISDYGKGFLTTPLLQAAIDIAKKSGVPLIVDPKGTDFTKYRGATILKPNLSEAYAAAKLPSSASLDDVASELLHKTQVDYLLITRSEAGISLFEANGERRDFPVRSKEVKDVTGAGDTVLATLCLTLANNIDMGSAMQLANIAAGISIERLGCVQVTLPDIAKRLLEYDVENKIFDDSHVRALAGALQHRKYGLLLLDSTQEMTNSLYRSIRHLSQDIGELLVCIQQGVENEFVSLLSKLGEVDFILLQTEHLQDFTPHAIYTFKNGELVAVGKDILSSLLNQSLKVSR